MTHVKLKEKLNKSQSVSPGSASDFSLLGLWPTPTPLPWPNPGRRQKLPPCPEPPRPAGRQLEKGGVHGQLWPLGQYSSLPRAEASSATPSTWPPSLLTTKGDKRGTAHRVSDSSANWKVISSRELRRACLHFHSQRGRSLLPHCFSV